ncbi:hypothetical protein [Streptomyces mobaraensis]|uniref:Uncharacterized protein n=1 Tax=Streptomyces mobaraensis TaxID=35621 RepID=A0A5N5W6T7_STRMB|nr:hypothetical protein [Streptomyces mobaraensis]KAB7843776.1 hypothetical protein FRZ00_17685 [Streptomyces mobaraensis]
MSEHTQAAARLLGVQRFETAARRRGGWYAAYLWIFAGWQPLLVPAVVLWHGPAAAAVVGALNAALVGVLSWYAGRQPVVPRHFARTHLTVIGTWAALYTGTVVLGTTVLKGNVPLAVVAAVTCALPPAVGALQGIRR